MKKILFIFREMGSGGAQKIEAFVANSLCKHGEEVVAINMSNKPITVQLDSSVKIINVPYDEICLVRNRICRTIFKIDYLYKLRSVIKSISPDVVVAFLSDIIRITVLAMSGMNIPIIGSERGDPGVLSVIQYKKYRKAYMKCKGVVFQLPSVKNFYSLPGTIKQAVIPNPCTPRLDSCWTMTFSEDARVIVSAGRLEKQKRFDLLIDAFKIVSNKYPNYQLVIYGEGSQRMELQRRIEEYHLEKSIKLFGDVSDVFSATNMKDVAFFALSSDYEGIPNVILEAMMSGVPCVATDCTPGGARFLLEDGELGLISPKGDAEKLAKNMIKYIENVELRLKHVNKAKVAVDKYSPGIIERKWIHFIETCRE